MLETFLYDVRFALRMLVKQSGLTAVALITLALAVGANTAIFSVVKAVVLHPLPYKDSERIVRIWNTFPPLKLMDLDFAEPEFITYRNRLQSLDQVAAFSTATQSLIGSGEPERVTVAWTSADFFPLLGTQPVQGRVFTAEEDRAGHNNVMLISHRLWQNQFGSDPDLVGKPLTLSGRVRTVIGIMPPEFRLPNSEVDVWIPLAVNPASTNIGLHYMGIFAHLAPGATVEQATAEMESVLGEIAQQFPAYFKGAEGASVRIIPLREQIVGNVRTSLLVLFAAVFFMLLIGCVNIANLLLARAATRQREIAVRAALGASRARIISQLLTESLILFVLGGALGFLIALWSVRLVVRYSPLNVIPRLHEVSVDGMVFGFTLLISVLTGVIFGLVPALQASKPNLNDSLKEGSRGGGGSLRRNRTRSLLVVSEVALALVPLIGAGLMIKSFMHLLDVNLGYNPQQALTMRLSLSPIKYPQSQQMVGFYQQLLERIRALPGVQTVAVVNQLPLDKTRSSVSFDIQGRELQPGSNIADNHLISPDYFQTMGIPLVKGRFFTDQDGENNSVVIINQTLADRIWPDEDPIGKRVKFKANTPEIEIVGVVADTKNHELRSETKSEVYLPYTKSSFALFQPGITMALVARTASDPILLTNPIKETIRTLDTEVPVYNAQTMNHIVSDSISEPRFLMTLLVVFAAIALILTAIGVYGVISQSVTQRTYEIGIRKALGARPQDIFSLVVSQGLLLALVGLAIGLIGAFVLTKVISSLLYDVSATDPIVFIGVSLLLAVVALLASYLPARRAMKVDPIITLRYE